MPHDVAFHMPEPSRVSVFSMGGSPCRSIDGVVTGAAVKETCLAQLHVKRRSRALIVTSSILLIQHLPLPFALALEPNHRSSKLFVYHSHTPHTTLHAPRQTPSHPHTLTSPLPTNMRGNDPQTKVHYKGSNDDFVIIVESAQAVQDWKKDSSIPLSQVVAGWKVFVTHKSVALHAEVHISAV